MDALTGQIQVLSQVAQTLSCLPKLQDHAKRVEMAHAQHGKQQPALQKSFAKKL